MDIDLEEAIALISMFRMGKQETVSHLIKIQLRDGAKDSSAVELLFVLFKNIYSLLLYANKGNRLQSTIPDTDEIIL